MPKIIFFFMCKFINKLLLQTFLCMISLHDLIHTMSISNLIFIIFFLSYSSRSDSSKAVFFFNITIGNNTFMPIKKIGAVVNLFICYFKAPSFFRATKSNKNHEKKIYPFIYGLLKDNKSQNLLKMICLWFKREPF